MKKNIILAMALSLPLAGFAQGNNTGMGGNDGNYESLAHRVFNLEKKTDAFNVYFNYASSFQEYDDGNAWTSSFKNSRHASRSKETSPTSSPTASVTA